MVAFAGGDPIAVLIGAKRTSGTLIQKIAVHPDHLRQGHGRHLLASLGSKLSILGPPRIVAEIPESLVPACELFRACGYVEEARLTDYVYKGSTGGSSEPAAPSGRLVIPLNLDDLEANGLLSDLAETCWERSIETVIARKNDISGLAIATDEQIEAYLLYTPGEIVALRSFIEDGGARVQHLLSRIGAGPFRFPKIHPAEVSIQSLVTLGFRAARTYVRYAGMARAA
jgi:hypothetical protein